MTDSKVITTILEYEKTTPGTFKFKATESPNEEAHGRDPVGSIYLTKASVERVYGSITPKRVKVTVEVLD